jgi:bifunctional UDP-N-acetylglucosamine pyrophosphorylase/glucosamine-1-phosphate N-acetyltransferase
VSVLHTAGYRVQSMVLPDPLEAAGVNDRAQLAVAEAELRDRINERWMRRGVTMWDPERTYVDAEVQLAADVSLLPGVILRGQCVIGEGSEIGPNCMLTDTTVGQHAKVTESTCDRSTVGDGAKIGPYAVLRAGSEVAPGAVIAPNNVVDAVEA